MEIKIAASPYFYDIDTLTKHIKEHLFKKRIKTKITLLPSTGLLYAEPILEITSNKFKQPKIYTKSTSKNILKYLDDYIGGDFKLSSKTTKLPSINNGIILKKFGTLKLDSIQSYIKNNGYKAFTKIFGQTSKRKTISEIKESELRRRNNSNELVGIKLEKVYNEKFKEKIIISNSYEADPASIKEKLIIHSNPHSVIEGMLISAYIVGAKTGYIFINSNDELSEKHLKTAIYEAKINGFLGNNILNSSYSFNIKIKKGYGSFLLDMDKAVILSMEDKRFLPDIQNNKPEKSGYQNKPTLILSGETFSNIPKIVLDGAESYKKIGSQNNFGTKLITLSGKIKNYGVYEVKLGESLKTIIEKTGGGVISQKKLKAVQIGGPNGIILPEKHIDIPFDFDTLKNLGGTINLGSIVIFDESSCIVETVLYSMNFLSKQSCGKCTICRIGLKRIVEILENITKGKAKIDDLRKLKALSVELQLNSLCGFGKEAATPVLSSLKYFRDEYTEHIEQNICPAKKCSALIKYKIISKKCTDCGQCTDICPVNAIIKNKKGKLTIEQSLCIKCNACFEICEENAILIS